MMVSIALAMIIMLVVTTAFSQGSALFNTSNAKIEALHNGKVAMKVLTNDYAHLKAGQLFVGICSDLVVVPPSGPNKFFGVNNNSNYCDDANGVVDESIGSGNDLPEFYEDFDGNLSTADQRHGMEFLTIEGGQETHVMYYVTHDGRLVRVSHYPSADDDGDGVVDEDPPPPPSPANDGNNDGDEFKKADGSSFIPSRPITDEDPIGVNSWARLPAMGDKLVPGLNPTAERAYTIAYGVQQFRLRYFWRDTTNFTNGVWFDGWDSTDALGWNGVVDSGAPWDKDDDDVQFGKAPLAIEVTLKLVDQEGFLAKGGQNPMVIKRVYRIQ